MVKLNILYYNDIIMTSLQLTLVSCSVPQDRPSGLVAEITLTPLSHWEGGREGEGGRESVQVFSVIHHITYLSLLLLWAMMP